LYILWTSKKSAKNPELGLATRARCQRAASPESRVPTEQPWREAPRLLDLDLRADFLELLLDGRRLVLVHAFLDRLGRAFDEVLGFLEAKGGDLADHLDDV